MREITPDQWVTVITSGFTSVCALVFCAVYILIAPWRQTELGREVLVFRLVLGLLLLYSVVISFVPEEYQFWPRMGRGAGVAFVGVLLLRQLHILVRNQINGKKGRQKA